jgi:hypothetical protein
MKDTQFLRLSMTTVGVPGAAIASASQLPATRSEIIRIATTWRGGTAGQGHASIKAPSV